MKVLIIIALLLCLYLSLAAVVVESTLEGGVWTAPSTWVGNTVPAPTDNVVISSNVLIDQTAFCNDLTVQGNLMNNPGGTYLLVVNGNFSNYGTCQNNPEGGNLDMELRGNFSHHYVISNRNLHLAKSSGIMDIYQDENAGPISCQNMLGSSTAAGYRMLSDLRFSGTQVDLNSKDLFMHDSGTIYDIILEGGSLYRAVLKTNGFSNLTLNTGAYLHNVDAGDIVFQGVGLIYQGVYFDNLTVEYYSYLSPYAAGAYDLTVREDLINYGFITNGEGNIYLKLFGDLYLYNGLIHCYYVYFMGTGIQNLYQGPAAAPFVNNKLGKPSGVTAGELVLFSSLRTQNTSVDMNGCSIICYGNGRSQDIVVDGGFIYRANLITNGFSKLTMSNGAYLYYVDAGDFILDGITMPYTEVSFDDVVNQGTIQSYYGINTLVVNGVLHNWYNIFDATGSDLYLYLRGDLYNNGNISCYNIYLDGPQDQYLQLGGGVQFLAEHIYLISNWGNAQFWLNDNLVYQGNTYFNINAFPIGDWRIVAAANERHVILAEGTGVTLPTPQIISFSRAGELLELVWNEVPGAFYYMVYESDVPYGAYPDFYYVWDPVPGDGSVLFQTNPLLQTRFYRIYAHH